VIIVRGAPGTRGHLEWAEYRTDASGYAAGGYYGPTTRTLTFSSPGGAVPALVSVFDLPDDTDAVPLACQLERVDARGVLRAGPSCPARFVAKRQMLALPETYAPWAHRQRLAIAPAGESPMCPTSFSNERRVTIREPRSMSRFLFDPDTPRELSTVRLAASVTPVTEEIVWLVDEEPIARVGYPHEVRWPLRPGRHTIRARLARSGDMSAPVIVVVDD
jgi:penicillin-binding protein 1C